MNPQISFDQLPTYENISHTMLNPKYKYIARMNALIAFILTLAISIAIVFLFEETLAYIIAVLLFLLGSYLSLLNLFGYRYKSYAFRKHDAVFQSGIFVTHIEIIPYIKLQHITITQGWYAKKLGLATINLYSASADNEVTIPGLTLEEAEQWKEFVLNRVQTIENTDDEL
ncbi:PH domain-containing protein [Capnocytophaga sp. ARDL2]|uniref:PH domain-containing protein n=1 Tax=Capnocytophaga sp. ARDL2 TaxID=3238809 RepID=UPI003558F311